MNDLIIRYSISKKLKAASLVAGIYLLCISMYVSILQAIDKHFAFFFFAGIAGVLFALILVFSVTVWQPKPIIVIDNEQFLIHLPRQKIDGVIAWGDVSQIGIGLSFLTLSTGEGKNYKIDMENLKYSDLRSIKTKVIEVCEAKGIPYSNL
ncbi:MAG: hypothetical protein LBR48_03345 [Dysgonamonadaceae bacterium]|jgi:hypothetical protein|nr:hypothetical protein [Dysgonamonadaceae bacterium]